MNVNKQRQKMTNFEKIKNMSIDELADKLEESLVCDRCPISDLCEGIVGGDCTKACMKWLKSEAEE